jgi:hypothetical protein
MEPVVSHRWNAVVDGSRCGMQSSKKYTIEDTAVCTHEKKCKDHIILSQRTMDIIMNEMRSPLPLLIMLSPDGCGSWYNKTVNVSYYEIQIKPLSVHFE